MTDFAEMEATINEIKRETQLQAAEVYVKLLQLKELTKDIVKEESVTEV